MQLSTDPHQCALTRKRDYFLISQVNFITDFLSLLPQIVTFILTCFWKQNVAKNVLIFSWKNHCKYFFFSAKIHITVSSGHDIAWPSSL